MMKIKDIISKYAYFVSHRPWSMLLIVLIISIVAFSQAGNVGTKSQDNKDMLPERLPVIEAFNIIENQFGTTDSVILVIEIEPEVKASSEPRDIRDPIVLAYIDILGKYVTHVESVRSVSSAATILRKEYEVLPKTRAEAIEKIDDNPILEQYLSSDHEMGLIMVSLEDDYEDIKIVAEMNKLIDSLERPAGIMTSLAGEVIADPVVRNQIGPDMARTSNFSMILIIIILLVLLRSFIFGLSPLLVIILGIVWCFGYLGLRGIDISPAASGVVSMIMGIGIDFGIQIVIRYRYELGLNDDASMAMEKTMSSVIMPMSTTTLSALIGFKAMSMGELTFLAELGTIMSYGITSCFLVAITLIPPFMVLTDRAIRWFKRDRKDYRTNSGKQKIDIMNRSDSKGETNVKKAKRKH